VILKLKKVGTYDGHGLKVKRNEEISVDDDVGQKLIKTSYFEVVSIVKPVDISSVAETEENKAEEAAEEIDVESDNEIEETEETEENDEEETTPITRNVKRDSKRRRR